MNGYRQSGGFLSSIPPFVKFVLIANLAIYLFQILLGSFKIDGTSLNFLIQKYFSLIPLTFSSSNHPDLGGWFTWPWQFISYQFLHSIESFGHIFFNMFGVWMFGSELEREWGSAKFGMFYILCGIGAGLLQIFVSNAPTVGASGALFGVLIAFGMSYPDRKILMFPLFIPISAKYFVAFYAAIELFSGITRANDGVAHWAHLAGALTGFILLKWGKELGVWNLANKWFGGKGISSYNNPSIGRGYGSSGGSFGGGSPFGGGMGSGMRQNPFSGMRTRVTNKAKETYQAPTPKPSEKTYDIDGEKIDQKKIDDILDKISASGYQSLTDREKYILTELSKRI